MAARLLGKLYEPLIRRAAGLGRAPTEPDPDRYEHAMPIATCWSSARAPAGLSAAAAAAEEGARVILADDGALPGGSLLARRTRSRASRSATGSPAWSRGSTPCPIRTCSAYDGLGYYDHNQLALLEKVADHREPRPASRAKGCGMCGRAASFSRPARMSAR